MDANGFVIDWNPQAEETFGYSRQEALGCLLAELIIPEQLREAHAKGLQHFLATGEGPVVDKRLELSALNREGREFPVELTISTDPTPDAPRFYAFLHDIGARKQAEAELARAHAAAVDASRLKSEFVANTSHEIRTPLNGVIGMTELLRDTSLDPVQREYVDALATSGEALLDVIEQILDFSKIEAGRLELDRSDFDLRCLIEEACQMLAEQAHGKGLEISHWVNADVPATVHGDRARLRQILLNLLSNAVKFTDAGMVVLRVSRHGDDRLHFAVLDTGEGIEKDRAQQLFEPFVQADQSTTRRHGGTGLGLAISSQLALLMGGEIGAEPRETGGSTFWFTAELPEVPGTVASSGELRDVRTLIVDDNATNRAILEHYLETWGLAVESVDRPSTGLDALERASRDGRDFQLAVLDFNLPEMNGMELAGEIRRRPEFGGLKIVILSSAPHERELFAGVEIAAFLAKPARQSDLYERIVDALGGGLVERSA
jgi:two-component system sensor histidine kinase/response regulator